MDRLLFFKEHPKKIISCILDAPRGHIFNHIGTLQRRFLTYLAQYLHIAKYASKNAQNRFFCNFSKSSEKVAYLQKKVCQNPQHRSRCRYRRRKIVKIDRQSKKKVSSNVSQTVVKKYDGMEHLYSWSIFIFSSD